MTVEETRALAESIGGRNAFDSVFRAQWSAHWGRKRRECAAEWRRARADGNDAAAQAWHKAALLFGHAQRSAAAGRSQEVASLAYAATCYRNSAISLS